MKHAMLGIFLFLLAIPAQAQDFSRMWESYDRYRQQANGPLRYDLRYGSRYDYDEYRYSGRRYGIRREIAGVIGYGLGAVIDSRSRRYDSQTNIREYDAISSIDNRSYRRDRETDARYSGEMEKAYRRGQEEAADKIAQLRKLAKDARGELDDIKLQQQEALRQQNTQEAARLQEERQRLEALQERVEARRQVMEQQQAALNSDTTTITNPSDFVICLKYGSDIRRIRPNDTISVRKVDIPQYTVIIEVGPGKPARLEKSSSEGWVVVPVIQN